MTKWIRLIAMAVAFAAALALHAIPEVDASAEWVEWVSLAITFALAAWNAWKNNDFTFAAKLGTEVMNALKDGKITEEEVKGLLGCVDADEDTDTDKGE